MDKNLEIERFGQVLKESLAEEAENRAPALSDLEPLSLEMEARLLRISLSAPSPRAFHLRVADWLEEKVSRRILIPAAVLSSVAVLTLILSSALRKEPVERLAFQARAESPRKVLGGPVDSLTSQSELHVRRGQYLLLHLTPVRQQKGDIKVLPFIKRGETIERWPVEFEHGEDGSFRLYVPVDSLPNLEKTQEVLLAIGRPNSLPDVAELRTSLQPDHRRWYVEPFRLYIDE